MRIGMLLILNYISHCIYSQVLFIPLMTGQNSNKHYRSVIDAQSSVQVTFPDSVFTFVGSVSSVRPRNGILFCIDTKESNQKKIIDLSNAIRVSIISHEDSLELIKIDGYWVRKLHCSMINGKEVIFFDYSIRNFKVPVDFYLLSASLDGKIYETLPLISFNFRRGFSKFLSEKLDVKLDYKNYLYIDDMWKYFITHY